MRLGSQMSDTSVQVFSSQEFGQLRVIQGENGEPWFVAKDMCDALGIATNHLREEGRGLDDDEVSSLPNWEGRGAAPLIVSEAGLYSLVLKSRKPGAKRFKRWVTHEVLPAIRRDGGYMVARDDESDETLMARALLVADRAMRRLKAQNAALTEDNALMLPKATAWDSLCDSDGTMSVTKAARSLAAIDPEITQKRLYALLRADEIFCKRDNTPTRDAIDRGLAVQKVFEDKSGHVRTYGHLTAKGLDWCVAHYCKQRSE